jgi:hypothetical protein
MNTKQTLITITAIALLVIGLGWYLSETDDAQAPEIIETSTTTVVTIPVEEVVLLPELVGIMLSVPDFEGATATITAGANTTSEDTFYSATFGDNSDGFIAVVDNRLAAVSAGEFIVPFAVSEGGSGTFSYLGLLIENEDGLIHTSSALLGDRIRITDVSVEDGIVVVETLDRHNDQAMSDEPATRVIREFSTMDGKLLLENEYRNVSTGEISAEFFFNPTTNSIVLSGIAPRNWFFEGDFPVAIISEDRENIGVGFVSAETTEETGSGELAFAGEINDIEYLEDEIWFIVFTKDNPSEDRSLDASYTTSL